MKSPMWDHQKECFEKVKDIRAAGLFLEQRLGKSRVCVEKATRHYLRDEIDAVLVVSYPSGIHTNWILDEFPEWAPDDLPWRGLAWNSGKAGQVGYCETFNELLAFKGLAVLSVNCEALISDVCKKAISRFFKARRAIMTIADESSFMANWCRRTRTMLSIAKHSAIRVICDGTPADEGPFDLYFPMQFLDPAIIGMESPTAFRHHYAELETQGDRAYYEALGREKKAALAVGKSEEEAQRVAESKARRAGRSWLSVKQYRNIDELQDRLALHTYRKTRAECFDVPAKVYQKLRFDLDPECRRIYDKLRDEFIVELVTGELSVGMKLTRVLRLQQIASGYYPEQAVGAFCAQCGGDGCDACGDVGVVEGTIPMQRIGKINQRLRALGQSLEALKGPAVVWSRFVQDVDDVMALGQELHLNPVRYDGRVSDDEKLSARRAFQSGESRLIVGNEASLQRGIRLDRAAAIYGYANHFSLRMRRQVEDRAESHERTVGTGVIDLVANGTVDDTLIIPALREKRRIADMVMGDAPGAWL